MTNKQTKRSFWILFVILVGAAALGSLMNIHEFTRMNRLNAEGKRIRCPVDSIGSKGSKTEIFVKFKVDGKDFSTSKKVKAQINKGDTVSVYYLENDPSTNGIATE